MPEDALPTGAEYGEVDWKLNAGHSYSSITRAEEGTVAVLAGW
jgi:hypothetical protein